MSFRTVTIGTAAAVGILGFTSAFIGFREGRTDAREKSRRECTDNTNDGKTMSTPIYICAPTLEMATQTMDKYIHEKFQGENLVLNKLTIRDDNGKTVRIDAFTSDFGKLNSTTYYRLEYMASDEVK